MDQTTKTMLLATATAEVAKRLESFIDFELHRSEGRSNARVFAQSLGIQADLAEKDYEVGFDLLQKQMRDHMEQKAANSVAQAVEEAEMEQRAHSYRLTELRGQHSSMRKALVDRHRDDVKSFDEELGNWLSSFHDDLLHKLDAFNADMLGLVQKKHRLELLKCFQGCLMGEKTALRLVDLYEVN